MKGGKEALDDFSMHGGQVESKAERFYWYSLKPRGRKENKTHDDG